MAQFLADKAQIQSLLAGFKREETSGEVVFHHNSISSKLYLRAGAIVWANTPGQKETFQSILLRERGLSSQDLLDAIRQAKLQGRKNPDELLRALGVDDPTLRRSILRRHTRSALDALLSWPSSEVEIKEPGEQQSKAHKQTLSSVLNAIRETMSAAKTVVLVDAPTAMPVSSAGKLSDEVLEAVTAYAAEVVESSERAYRALGTNNDAVLEPSQILISGKECAILLSVLGSGECFLCVVLDSGADSNAVAHNLKPFIRELQLLLG